MHSPILTRVLIILGGILAALGLITGHANRVLLDGPAFAEHVDEIRRDDAVARAIGHTLADQIIDVNPDLVALRPVVNQVAVEVVGSEVLSTPTRLAARTAHNALVSGDGEEIALRIADAGAVVTAALATLTGAETTVWSDASVTLAAIGQDSLFGTVLTAAAWIGVLTWALPLAALLCFAFAVWLSREHWRTAGDAGWAIIWAAGAVGLVLVAGALAVRWLVEENLAGAVARAAWASMGRPLWWGVGILAALGLAAVLACTSNAFKWAHATTREWAERLIRPRRTLGVVIRAVVASALGLAALIDPQAVIEPLIAIAGFGLALFGLAEVSRLIAATRPRHTRTTLASRAVEALALGEDSDDDEDDEVLSPAVRRGAVAVLVSLVLVAVGGVGLQSRPGGELEAVAADVGEGVVCNGHADLCDRPFDEVAYLSTHNSMADASDHGWFIPEQRDAIPVQLEQGVRALLIDVWPGRAAGEVVRTSTRAHQEALAVAEAELGPHAVAAALRVADSVAGQPQGPEQRYLCHGLCEIGATPFVRTLEHVRSWLVAHPDEVLSIIIEDYVEPSEIATDVEAAGLLPFVRTPEIGAAWPTLAEMIRSGERLVVMLEEGEGGPEAPWLVNAWDHVQDTPYTFDEVEDFSCEPNRGDDDAPFFLLNHWLSGFTSLVTDAQLVNTMDVLGARAEQCWEERGQIPNYVAVNFSAIGDGLAVVDELNGVASD